MRCRRFSPSRLAAVAVVTFCAWAAYGQTAPGAPQPPRQARPSVARADAESVRAAADDILAQDRFRQKQSLWEFFWSWLREKLFGWSLPNVGEGWGRVVLWIIVVWCLLTLLAILGHLVWTIVMLVRGRGAAGAVVPGAVHFRPGTGLSYEQLLRQMQESAEAGEFAEALAYMMAALLRWLDRNHLVTHHDSKTNGEYVREYPPQAGGREDFRRFVLSFDATIYGGAPCGDETYRRLSSTFERVRQNAGKKP